MVCLFVCFSVTDNWFNEGLFDLFFLSIRVHLTLLGYAYYIIARYNSPPPPRSSVKRKASTTTSPTLPSKQQRTKDSRSLSDVPRRLKRKAGASNFIHLFPNLQHRFKRHKSFDPSLHFITKLHSKCLCNAEKFNWVPLGSAVGTCFNAIPQSGSIFRF